ncbi:MAG: hypothetical protein IPM39_10295 [Chloroflexi bacterium]|nr:hypothetical protein [Chloroflexota bacterium]
MSKTIVFLSFWLALLTGCTSPTGNELVGTATAVPPTAILHTGETAVTPTPTTPTIVVDTTPPLMPDGATPTINVPEPTPTPTPSGDRDLSLFLPQCDRRPLTGLPTQPHPETGETWARYANEAYGFAFTFPPEWELVEGQNYICLNYLPQPETRLIIGFKWFDDKQTAIVRSGVAAGDLTTTGTVSFLGREIDRNILRYEGKEKAVLYNNAATIRANDLLFTLSLDDFSTSYETAELTPEIMQMADAIVASFELIDRLYVNETYGFSFVAPPEWRLRPAKVYGTPDDQNAIQLSYRPDRTNNIVLSIGFKRQDEEDIHIVRTGVPEMDEAITSEISFMGRTIGRDVLRYEGKNKMILYHGGGPIQINDLIFTLSLDYFGTNYRDFAMPVEVMTMADEIVQSFALVGE